MITLVSSPVPSLTVAQGICVVLLGRCNDNSISHMDDFVSMSVVVIEYRNASGPHVDDLVTSMTT